MHILSKSAIFYVVLLTALLNKQTFACVHDLMTENASFHFYEDSLLCDFRPMRRIMQSITKQKLRIYADYTQLIVGDTASINVIKRSVNISANFFYNTLYVQRLQKLLFPTDSGLKCNVLDVPASYQEHGVIGDLGIIVGNQDNNQTYVARSISCALLKSNNRPIWGAMIFNNRNLGFSQIEFQKTVSVAIHQMTHILGFSSALFEYYPAGNPLIIINDYQYLKSPKILQEIANHFNCSNSFGLPLQDQDGTLYSSHQQKKILGTQFMIAVSKKQAFFSRFTFALLDSTGWYDVNYTYAENTGWGKNKGCSFMDVDICDTEQYCNMGNEDSNGLSLDCDWDGTAYGSCTPDPFTNSCSVVNYYTNTVCIDEFYEKYSLTQPMNAKQIGGYTSRCYKSNFRATGLTPIVINFRCYVTVCSSTSPLVYVKVNGYILLCRSTGAEVPAPYGMQGTLTCPSYKKYCQENKKTCAYHCNKNGVCINGMCLCTGSTVLTATCLDESNMTISIENTGGLTKSIIIDDGDRLHLVNSNRKKPQRFFGKEQKKQIKVTTRSINTKCMQGTYLDEQFGGCVKCPQFDCQKCQQFGCGSCERCILSKNTKRS